MLPSSSVDITPRTAVPKPGWQAEVSGGETGTMAETRAVRSVLNSRLCIAKKGNDCANYGKKEARASIVTLVPPASVSCLRPHPGCHQRRGLERLRVVGAGETAPASAAPDSSVGRRGRTQHRRTDKTRGHPRQAATAARALRWRCPFEQHSAASASLLAMVCDRARWNALLIDSVRIRWCCTKHFTEACERNAKREFEIDT